MTGKKDGRNAPNHHPCKSPHDKTDSCSSQPPVVRTIERRDAQGSAAACARRRTGRLQTGNAADGLAGLPSGRPLPFSLPRAPTERLHGGAFPRPSALRRFQEGFHFAVLPLNTRKLPSADTEGHGNFSTSSLRPLRPLRLKATIPFPCFQCIPWLFPSRQNSDAAHQTEF